MGSKPFEDPVDDRTVEFCKQLRFYSEWHELRRLNQGAGAVAKPCEDLIGEHSRRSIWIDDRLSMDLDPFVTDCFAELLDSIVLGTASLKH